LKTLHPTEEDLEQAEYEDISIFTEGEKSFLSLFSDCLKPATIEIPEDPPKTN
jgi:hypothetical protein